MKPDAESPPVSLVCPPQADCVADGAWKGRCAGGCDRRQCLGDAKVDVKPAGDVYRRRHSQAEGRMKWSITAAPVKVKVE